MSPAGEYNTKIIFQEKTTTKDENNAPDETWSNQIECWAKKNDFQGREFWDAMQTSSEITGEFETRYRTDINSSMRIKEKNSGNIFSIESVIDPNNNHEKLLIRVNRNEN